MRVRAYLSLAIGLAVAASWVQGQDQKAEIQQRLASQFTLTKTTADRTDIVTPGSVLLLKKDGLIMFSLDAKVPATTTYKDGKLSMSFGDAMATTLVLGGNQTASNVPQRKFVAGEKFWITSYSVTDKHAILLVYSDPVNDVRYYGQIKFPFQKHNIPPADDLLKTIAEVLTVEPAENPSNSGQQATKADAAMPAPITPPPPPADMPAPSPKTIALGQTKDQVLAAFGQPQKVATVGTKEIDSYPDMKVTFVDGKVVDVQ